MGLITELWDTAIVYRGRRYRTNAAYDTVLAMQKLYKDERLSDAEKAEQALCMLLRHRRLVKVMSPEMKTGLLEEIFKSQIAVPAKPPSREKTRVVDFELDGEYIYASFYQDYGIDLVEEQGRLHWKKFLALFQGLSDETKIKQIMNIRSMDIPEPTKYNQKQIQKLLELKSYYALPVQGGGGQTGLNSLFGTLEGLAR